MTKHLPIILLVILTLALGLTYAVLKGQNAVVRHDNPAPVSGYAIAVGDINPGNQVQVSSVDLEQSATLVVIKDGKKQTQIGASPLLTVGHHDGVVITLTSPIVDGDVVLVELVDQNGKPVKGVADADIMVKKNVGQLMTHYASEY